MRNIFAFLFLLFIMVSGFYFIRSIINISGSHIVISTVLLIGCLYGYLKLSNFNFNEIEIPKENKQIETAKIDIKFHFKIIFAITFLFLLFLNSGGLYEYKSNSQGVPMFRVNKITNNIQSLDNKGWRDILKDEED